MKNIWIITKTNIKRNFFSIFMSVFGAFALCFLLYVMGNMAVDITLEKVMIGVIDEDQSKLSEDFKNYITEELDFGILDNNSYDMLSTELIEKNISVIIEIPKDFYEQISAGNNKEITITTTDDYENAAFLQAYLNNYLGNIRFISNSAAGDQKVFDQLLTDYKNGPIEINQVAAPVMDEQELTELEGFNHSIGFFLMIIFALGVFIAFMIIDDRFSGVFNRIKITPVKPVQYIIGSGVFGILLCLIEVGIYCGYIIIKDIDIGFPVGLLILTMSLFSLFTVCFSVTIALSIKSKSAITSIIIGFSTVGAILGGAYFPLDLAPKSLQNLARVLPQFWFMDTFRRIQADPKANLYPNFIIMTLFTALAFLIGAVLFNQNHRNS